MNNFTISSLPNFSKLLEFDNLIKSITILQFQRYLKELLVEIKKEILNVQINVSNLDLTNKLFLSELNEAINYSGGDLSNVKRLVLEVFEYTDFDMNTEFNIRAVDIRKLLIWTDDSNWSYSEVFENYKYENQNIILAQFNGLNFRRFTFGLLYQDAIKFLISFFTSEFNIEEPEEVNENEILHEQPLADKNYISIKKLAEKLGVSKGTIHNYANKGIIQKIYLSKRKVVFDIDKLNFEELSTSKYLRTLRY